MNQAEIIKSPESVETTNLVHLEDWAEGRDDRAWCGAPVRTFLPSDTQIDCVVCAALYESWLQANPE